MVDNIYFPENMIQKYLRDQLYLIIAFKYNIIWYILVGLKSV